MPKRPYLPPGTLRAALVYPAPATKYSDEEFIKLIEPADLQRIASSLALSSRWDLQPIASLLDISANWDRVLTEDEQQLLVFVRLLLSKPQWVVIDQALDSLERDARRQILAMLAKRLPTSTIIHIGRSVTDDQFFTRALHLVKDPGGLTFDPGGRATAGKRPTIAAAVR